MEDDGPLRFPGGSASHPHKWSAYYVLKWTLFIPLVLRKIPE